MKAGKIEKIDGSTLLRHEIAGALKIRFWVNDFESIDVTIEDGRLYVAASSGFQRLGVIRRSATAVLVGLQKP